LLSLAPVSKIAASEDAVIAAVRHEFLQAKRHNRPDGPLMQGGSRAKV
jgi:hypothetical protein